MGAVDKMQMESHDNIQLLYFFKTTVLLKYDLSNNLLGYTSKIFQSIACTNLRKMYINSKNIVIHPPEKNKLLNNCNAMISNIIIYQIVLGKIIRHD